MSLPDHAKLVIDKCVELKARFVTCLDLWQAVGGTDEELIATLRYAQTRNVTVEVVPKIEKDQ